MTKIFLILLAIALAGCARLPEPSFTSNVERGNEAFARLANDYIEGYLAWRPQTGTQLGLHQHDGKLTDFSQASLDIELGRLKRFEQRLLEFDTTSLSPKSFHDLRILRNSVKREIFGFQQMRNYWENPMTYSTAIDVNIYIKRNFAPLEQRVKSIVAILNQAPAVMAAARANLAASLPRPKVETAIDEATGAADFLSKDLVAALKQVANPQLMAELNTANQRAIQELRGYAAYLKDQKLPSANERYALGREKYVQLLLHGEMITKSPEELLDLGMRELRRQQQEFAKIARQIDPKKKPIDVFKAIQKDHPTEQSLIPDTAKNLEMIRQFLVDHQIVTLPSQVRAQVKETPQFLRATSFASMDTPGPFETKAREAYYYVTPVEPHWPQEQKEEWLSAFNYYTTDIVSIHEAYPGHYVQFLALNASPATKLQKIFISYAFSEGWAHYTEQMMIDEGFGEIPEQRRSVADPIKAAKYRLAQLDEALLRLCRLCVSIKMHCQGMTVDEGTRFFEENCYYEPKPARQEAIRGSYDPEYLYYTLGKMQILKLRQDWRLQEGSKFSLQRFHDEMLKHGAPPIRLLRELMLKNRRSWAEVL
jgi:uncharacterized protein (DUF885 family)